MQDILNGRDAGDRLLGEDAELQGERPRELALEINGAAAHAGNDAGVLDFWPLKLNEDDGLLWAEEILKHTQDFEVELLDLVAGKDGVGVTLHAGLNLANRKDFRLLRVESPQNQAQLSEERKKSEQAGKPTIRRMRPGGMHELSIIRGSRTRGNRTGRGCPGRKV